MSKYKRIATEFKSTLFLLNAFDDVNIPVERGGGNNKLPLVGFVGDIRPEQGDFVIRRHNIEKYANDMGFIRREDGGYDVLISEYDSRPGGRGLLILNKIKQRYAYHAVVDAARKKGYTVQEKKGAGGVIQLQLVSYK